VGSGEGKRTGAFFFIAGRAHKAESEGNDESGRGCVARSPRSGFPSGMEEGTGRGTGWCVGGRLRERKGNPFFPASRRSAHRASVAAIYHYSRRAAFF